MIGVDEKHPFAKKPTRKEWDALVCYSELSDAQLCGDVGERKRKQRPSKEPSCWPKKECLVSVAGTAPVGRIWVWATYGNFSSFVSSFMDLKERRLSFKKSFECRFVALLW